MLKSLLQLEHKIEDKVFHFHWDARATLSDVKNAVAQFMSHAVSIENSVKAQQAATTSPVEAPPEATNPQG